MKKIWIHISIALICTVIGTCIYLYQANILFPVKPIHFEPEPQTLKSIDMLEPEEMLEDFAYLVEVIESVHPDPYHRIGKEEWIREKNALLERFKQPMRAADYYFALNELVVAVGDAHTVLWFDETDKGLPLCFDWVKEGLVIAEDHGLFKRGDLVLKIGNKQPDELLHDLSLMVAAENIYWVKNEAKTMLKKRSVLEQLGLLQNEQDETVLFSVERDGEVLELTSYFKEERTREDDENEILEDRHGWYIDKENDLALWYFKVCIDDEKFREDVEEFFHAVKDNHIQKVVIDVRENIGGNSGVIDAFLRQLPVDSYTAYGATIKYSKLAAERAGMRKTKGTSTHSPSTRRVKKVENPFKGDVFILTGNQTFSSGNWIAVIFYDNKLGTIVGEPTGNAPSSYGDVLRFQLPNTGFLLRVSYKYFTRPDPSNDPADALYPHITINKTRGDLINGTDPILDYFDSH